MKKILIFFWGAICVASCNQNKKLNGYTNPDINYEIVERIDLRDVQQYKSMLLSELFSTVKYIPLEMTNRSVIGEIEKMEVTENGDLLVFDRHSHSVLKFAGDGKFLNTIGQMGHAENEYVEPLDMVYDEKNHQVVVYDNAKKSLKYYTENGKYLESVTLPWYINSFEILDSGMFLLYMKYEEFSSSDSIGYNYVVIDKNINVLNKFAPYEKRFFSSLNNVFNKDNGRVYCHIPMTPVVNEISANEMTPVYHIDFGKKEIPLDWYNDVQFDQKIEQATDIGYTWSFYKSGKRNVILFSCKDENGKDYPTFFTYSNGASVHYSNLLVNDVYGMASTNSRVKFLKGKNVYFELTPHNFEKYVGVSVDKDISKELANDLKRTIKEGKYSDRWTEIFNSLIALYSKPSTKIVVTSKERDDILRLSKHNNPIIQVCTLKD